MFNTDLDTQLRTKIRQAGLSLSVERHKHPLAEELSDG
jgi:hypothetical protein